MVLALEQEKADVYIRYFTVEDGLPSNEVYDLELDTSGYLWIATENGIARFNGSVFKTYSANTYSPVVLQVERAPDYSLWFCTVNNEILKYDGEKDQIVKVYDNSTPPLLPNGIITDFKISATEIKIVGASIVTIKNYNHPQQATFTVRSSNDKQRCCFSDDHLELITEPLLGGFNLIIRTQKDTLSTFFASKKHTSISRGRSWFCGSDLYLQVYDYLFKLDTIHLNLMAHYFKGYPTPSLELMKDTTLWVGNIGYGVTEFTERLSLKRTLAKDQSVTAIKKEKSGELWLATLDHGIGFVSNLDIHFIDGSRTPGKVNKIAMSKDRLILHTNLNHTYSIQKDGGNLILEHIDLPIGRVGNIYLNDSLLFFRIANDLYQVNLNQKRPKFEALPTNAKSLMLNRRVVMPHYGLLYRSDTAKELLYKGVDNGLTIRYQYELNSGEVYFGGFGGTGYLHPDSSSYWEVKTNQTFDLRDLIELENDTVILFTKGAGAYKVHNGKVISAIKTEPEQLMIILNAVKLNGQIWLSTPNRLYLVEALLGDTMRLVEWNKFLGFGRIAIDRLEVWENYLVLSTSQGLLIFDPQKIATSALAPKIIEINLKQGEEVLFEKDNGYHLNYDHTDLKVYIEAISYSNNKQIHLRYKIDAQNALWNYGSVNPIQFPRLSAGKHKLVIEVQNRFGQWSNPSTLWIHVQPPFWKTGWFIVLLILVLVAIVVFIFSIRERRIRNRNQLLLALAESRNKALSLQLNPHFVFNAINSLIAFIAKNDMKTTLQFLGKFAKLMRKIFENSQFQFVKFDEELDAVKRYLEIEEIRLRNKFEYQLVIDSSIHTDELMIPPLIIQPFVENAIWHGLVHSEREDGKIVIQITRKGTKKIDILIQDNGGGADHFTPASRISKKRLSSTQLIAERMDTLNRIYEGQFGFEQSRQEDGGYKVRIWMPVIEFKDIESESDNHRR